MNRRETKQFERDLKDYISIVEREPDPKEIRKGMNSVHIPISIIEAKLDLVYRTLWQVKNARWTMVGNEVIGAAELWVFHPVLKEWIVREGFAAVQIMMNKISKEEQDNGITRRVATDIGAKQLNCMEKMFPKLKSAITKNAAKSYGKWFGRDLGRKDEDTEHYTNIRKSREFLAFQDAAEVATGQIDLQDAFFELPAGMRDDPVIDDIFTANKERLQNLVLTQNTESDGSKDPELFQEKKGKQ